MEDEKAKTRARRGTPRKHLPEADSSSPFDKLTTPQNDNRSLGRGRACPIFEKVPLFPRTKKPVIARSETTRQSPSFDMFEIASARSASIAMTSFLLTRWIQH